MQRCPSKKLGNWVSKGVIVGLKGRRYYELIEFNGKIMKGMKEVGERNQNGESQTSFFTPKKFFICGARAVGLKVLNRRSVKEPAFPFPLDFLRIFCPQISHSYTRVERIIKKNGVRDPEIGGRGMRNLPALMERETERAWY